MVDKNDEIQNIFLMKQESIKKYLVKKPNVEDLIKRIEQKSKEKRKQTEKKKQKEEDEASQNSNISAKTQKVHVNLDFYLNGKASEPNGDTIEGMHKHWWGNYKLLEKHHGYIQWLFPNAFQSRFNSKSHPLTPEQEKAFRENPIIAEKYLKSYQMMLQFFGMKLKCKKTGKIARSRIPAFQQRYYLTLLTSFHNHMRVTRILSSLVMVGLGRFAKQLCLFLKQQIFGENGGLKQLRRYGVYREWRQFQLYEEKEEDLNIILKQKKKKQKQ